jgi:hypothetical protein
MYFTFEELDSQFRKLEFREDERELIFNIIGIIIKN